MGRDGTGCVEKDSSSTRDMHTIVVGASVTHEVLLYIVLFRSLNTKSRETHVGRHLADLDGAGCVASLTSLLEDSFAQELDMAALDEIAEEEEDGSWKLGLRRFCARGLVAGKGKGRPSRGGGRCVAHPRPKRH